MSVPDFTAPLNQLWESTTAFAPTAASALAVFAGLWICAAIARRVVGRLLGLTALDRLVGQTRVGRVLDAFGEDFTASKAVAGAIYLALMLMAVMAAADALGLEAVQTAIAAALGFAPKLFGALVVVGAGSFVAGAARRAVGAVLLEMRSPLAGPAETATEFGILIVAGVFALGILGIDATFVTGSLGLLVGMIVATICFLAAFAMRNPSVEIVANYYLRRMVRVGDQIELGEFSGTVERFTPLGVMLRDTKQRQRFVPASALRDGLTRSDGKGP